MISLDLYTKKDCSLCDKVKAIILRVQRTIPFAFREILLTPGTDIEKELRHDIPVLHINGKFYSRHSISENDLMEYLARLTGPGRPQP